ncbi:MAG: hypothetical protein IJ588_01075 [Prevotella sp.]|nr:hypothetical protein [Prevotella sp.]
MAKEKNNPVDEQQTDQQPDFLKELQETGTTTLTAPTREELNELVNNIPAEVTYGVGAVGFNAETRLYTLRIDLTNK